MKTKLSILLGAALCLLMTLTTTYAAGKGGGGGNGGGPGGGGPSGTIYYYGNFPGWSGTPTISMNADGSNKTVVGSDGWGMIFGNPSIHLHNDHRLFLNLFLKLDPDHVPTPEEPFRYLEDLDGSLKLRLAATRDDYNPDSNYTPQTGSVLIDDPTLQLLSGEQWLLDDGFISFVARRWSSTDPDATVVEGGIYVLPMVYDADGNMAGLGEQPTTPTVPLPMVLSDGPNTDGVEHPRPDVSFYSWAPAGDMYVYNKWSESGLWVADLSSGTETKISADPAYNPQWSPSGDTIVYGVVGGFLTIKPNGKRRTWILQWTSTWEYYFAYFSPDSQYLVFTGQSFESTGINHDIFVMNVNGGDLVNLTQTPGNTKEWTYNGNAGWR